MGQETQERRGLLATIRAFFGGAAAPEGEWSIPHTPTEARAPRHTPRIAQQSQYEGRAQTPVADTPAYRQRADFLSPAEATFFAVLREAAGADWHINAKVRLADLVDAPPGREWQAAWNKISRKHVDFVLCNPATLRPWVVIELDDRSHRRPDRIERDAFVDRVFADAALPILHIPVRRGYDPYTLRLQILGALDAPVPVAPQPQGERRCERCGATMQRRTARRGDYAGATFWGCTNFPRCRHIVPIAA